MSTIYLQVIDESALESFLVLRRVGTWNGILPPTEIAEECRVTLHDGCVEAPAKGSLAAYKVLEGLTEKEDFEDGVFVGGTQHLPIAAFHGPMYETMIKQLAKVIGDHEKVVARNFERGKIGRPMTAIAQVAVTVYEGGLWVAPGRVSEEVFVWEVALPIDVGSAETEPQPRAQVGKESPHAKRAGRRVLEPVPA